MIIHPIIMITPTNILIALSIFPTLKEDHAKTANNAMQIDIFTNGALLFGEL